MRFPICAILALAFTGCSPAAPTRLPVKSAPPHPAAPIAKARPVQPPPTPLPTTAASSTRVASWQIEEITFEGVAFDSRNHRLIVADQIDGPGTRYADSATAARACSGVAAINAGFFTPQGQPLGLVASAGKVTGAWNTDSSLGSGAWYEAPSGNSAIARRGKLGRAGASAMRELIQAGPLLIEDGKTIGGLETVKASARSLILWDGGTRWWIGRSSPCTLAALGQALATSQPSGWPIRQALNLDGGRSSDLWISGTIPGGPILRRPPWNRPVRNFLILVAR